MGRKRSEVERQNLTLWISKEVVAGLKDIYPVNLSKVIEALSKRHVERVRSNSSIVAEEILQEEDLKF